LASSESFVKEIQFENHRCLVIDHENLSPKAPVVFILHGLGANADDLFSLIKKMDLSPCLYVLPDAPIALGNQAYAWYDFQKQSREDTENSRDYLFRLMKLFSEEKPACIRPIIMMGFSQGGVMSMEAGLNYPGKVSAIVSMSGYIWDPSQTLKSPLASKKIPILLIHGSNDMIVTEDWTNKTVTALKKAGYKPRFVEFPMAHQISNDSLAEVSKFLKNVLTHQ
jgi:phospholipase/carboxylesterase